MEDSRMSAIAILYILKEYSDEAHPLSSNACIPLLEQVYDIKINRGTLSAYIKQLRNFGIDIQTTNRGYYLIDRDLENDPDVPSDLQSEEGADTKKRETVFSASVLYC